MSCNILGTVTRIGAGCIGTLMRGGIGTGAGAGVFITWLRPGIECATGGRGRSGNCSIVLKGVKGRGSTVPTAVEHCERCCWRRLGRRGEGRTGFETALENSRRFVKSSLTLSALAWIGVDRGVGREDRA